MRNVQGDLIELALNGVFDVIVHGCNCQCTMGAGIAKSIRAKFPEACEVRRNARPVHALLNMSDGLPSH